MNQANGKKTEVEVIRFICRECKKEHTVAVRYQGKAVRCKICSTILLVPSYKTA